MDEHLELLAAYESKDMQALWNAIARVPKREGAPILARALPEDWHEAHEDIVFELGLIGDPCAIDYIAKAVVIPFAYLVEWGNLHEFQRKCAYALARIGTPESRRALEAMAHHSDPHLQEYGKEGLEHWPLPYQGGEYE